MHTKAWVIEPVFRQNAAQIGYHDRSAEYRSTVRSGYLMHRSDVVPEAELPLLMHQWGGDLPPFPIAQGETNSQVVVNATVRDLILKMDPDACWFGPIEFRQTDGTILKDAHWLMRVVRDVDALVPERSRVRRAVRRVQLKDGSIREEDMGKWNPSGGLRADSYTLRGAAIVGRHIWFLAGVTRANIFVSDELLEALLDSGCEPFEQTPVTVI